MKKARNPNVSEILFNAHERMLTRINPTGQLKVDIEQAKVLTTFLSELKERAIERNASEVNINKDFYDLVLDNIMLPNNRTLYNLFRRIGKNNWDTGMKFEDDLGAVIASVVSLAENKKNNKMSYKTYSLGKNTGTTDIINNIEEEIENIIKEFPELTAEEIRKNKADKVMGKIDTIVNGNIVDMSGGINFPPGLLEALSNATFTDKSYKSLGWDKEEKKYVYLGDRMIHLGNSNPYRAVMGSLSSLGFTRNDGQYVFYAGRNIVIGNDTTPPPEKADHVKTHIYHLRYLYELTGAGIIYKDYKNSLNKGAKFLVYNDPMSSEIICISTAQIILDLLSQENFSGDPYGGIGISKAAIRAMNNR